jgi:peptide chain release factor 3
VIGPHVAQSEEGDAWTTASDELELLDGAGDELDPKAFLAGESSPTFFGSALTNFGVGALLDAVADLAPPPEPRVSVQGEPRGLDQPLSGFVFKVQANMDPNHRDRIAYFRVCSGEFNRGVTLTHAQSDKPVATKYAHSVFGAERETVDTAYPGDVVGLVGAAALRVGDTIYADVPVEFPGIPSFAPEHFQTARPADIGRFKQFRSGIAQLDEEGVIQVLRDPDLGDQAPVLAAVGPMQFDVATHRLENEFGAPARLEPTKWKVARRTDEGSEAELRRMPGTTVLHRADGTRLALFENPFWLDRLAADHPELTLEKLPAQ